MRLCFSLCCRRGAVNKYASKINYMVGTLFSALLCFCICKPRVLNSQTAEEMRQICEEFTVPEKVLHHRANYLVRRLTPFYAPFVLASIVALGVRITAA